MNKTRESHFNLQAYHSGVLSPKSSLPTVASGLSTTDHNKTYYFTKNRSVKQSQQELLHQDQSSRRD